MTVIRVYTVGHSTQPDLYKSCSPFKNDSRLEDLHLHVQSIARDEPSFKI